MELINDPEKYLAGHVLKQAMHDNDYDSRTMLTFWCDVVGRNPAAFFERAKKEEANG